MCNQDCIHGGGRSWAVGGVGIAFAGGASGAGSGGGSGSFLGFPGGETVTVHVGASSLWMELPKSPLQCAQEIAAEVRARKPEMQVRRIG